MTKSITNEQLQELLATTTRANNDFTNGDASGYIALVTHREDLTVTGPFGGPPTVGFEAYQRGAPLVASQFSNGTAQLELVQAHASGDLLVLVLLERQRACVAGGPERDWSLRVTQVYRREEGAWRVVHRHADPMVERQNIGDVLGRK